MGNDSSDLFAGKDMIDEGMDKFSGIPLSCALRDDRVANFDRPLCVWGSKVSPRADKSSRFLPSPSKNRVPDVPPNCIRMISQTLPEMRDRSPIILARGPASRYTCAEK